MFLLGPLFRFFFGDVYFGIFLGFALFFICVKYLPSPRRVDNLFELRKNAHSSTSFVLPSQKPIKVTLPVGMDTGSNSKNDQPHEERYEYYDTANVVVIGGGIHGAMIARYLSKSGMTVMLFDRGDFASGTSQNSAKLLHQGLKYFEDFMKNRDFDQLRMVIHGSIGRGHVADSAPHVVRPIGFVVLDQFGELKKYRLGLTAYDLIGRLGLSDPSVSVPWNRTVNNEEIRAQCPSMSRELKCDGVRYYEYSLDDSRYVLWNVKDAVRNGCYANNYQDVIGLEKDGNEYIVTVRDNNNNSPQMMTKKYRTQFVVNASGANVFDVSEKLSENDKKQQQQQTTTTTTEEVIKYKGCFIVIDRDIGKDVIVYRVLKGEKKKVIYMIPYGKDTRRTMIGTTDTFYFCLPLEVVSVVMDLECEDVGRMISSGRSNNNNNYQYCSYVISKNKNNDDSYTVSILRCLKGEMNFIILLNFEDDDDDDLTKNLDTNLHIVRSTGELEIVDKKEEEVKVIADPVTQTYTYFFPGGIVSIRLTCDVLMEKDCYTSVPSYKDIKYLVDSSNTFFADDDDDELSKIGVKDVISTFCGIRSYKKSKKKADSEKISRMHEIDLRERMINIYGGKLTTSHLLAEEVTKVVFRELGLLCGNHFFCNDLSGTVCGGYIKGDPMEYISRYFELDKKKMLYPPWLDLETYTHLVKFYGSAYLDVLGVIGEDPDRQLAKKLSPSTNHVEGEVVYGVRECFVVRPEDFLRRRTSLELEFGCGIGGDETTEEGRIIRERVEKLIEGEMKKWACVVCKRCAYKNWVVCGGKEDVRLYCSKVCAGI